MKIFVNKVEKENNVIKVYFDGDSEMRNFFIGDFVHISTYETDVESVPDSIAVIPFIANILPLIFVCKGELYTDSIDYDFFNCVNKYLDAYKKSINYEIPLSGKLVARQLVKHKKIIVNKVCMLYSGGIDATASLVRNLNIIDDCYAIWGADVPFNNDYEWSLVYKNISENVSKFGKNHFFIKTNIRNYINEGKLDFLIHKIDFEGWWHGFQHGIALLGQLAPLVYINGYKTIIIGSSFTKEYDPVCASNPRTDICFSVCGCKTVHDGFGLNRCEKVKLINDWVILNNESLKLHVCWQSHTGQNCGLCEKCLRSYLNCLCSASDHERLGITTNLPLNKIKKQFYLQAGSNQAIKNRIDVLYYGLCHYFVKIPSNFKWIEKIANNFDLFLKKRKKILYFDKIKNCISSKFRK